MNDAGSPSAASTVDAAPRYTLGTYVLRSYVTPYERRRDDPVTRRLRIYTVDPSAPRAVGSTAVAHVPFEPLRPGPHGAMLEVDNHDGELNEFYQQADLEQPFVLMKDGYDPSPADPRFHQQMVYAVCSRVYDTFRRALGRQLTWGFGDDSDVPRRLRLRPHAFNKRNAYYDEQRGEIAFGYYQAEVKSTGRNLPGGFVFTCLSHDIIAHEVTHAILDGLRPRYREPSSSDMLAFHEAFADLVAIFQHFSYPEVVENAIRTSGGRIEKAGFLTELAQQYGHTTGAGSALRSAVDAQEGADVRRYDETLEAHQLGSVLVAAVFDAFLRVYRNKTARYIRLATGGSGVLPPGELPIDLQKILAARVSALADQFLGICIRAIDYCPSTDLRFGDYLRALITADFDLVPEDNWGYREALVDGFRLRNIYPRGVSNLSEESLRWPEAPAGMRISELHFAELRFVGDPGSVMHRDQVQKQAHALGRYITRPDLLDTFGLAAADDSRLEGDTVGLPTIESIRSARRVGPDGQIVFDLVAEVSQLRTVPARGKQPGFSFYGGATIVIDPRGEVRYIVAKNVADADRKERRRAFLQQHGKQYWKLSGDRYALRGQVFRLIDETRAEALGHPEGEAST